MHFSICTYLSLVVFVILQSRTFGEKQGTAVLPGLVRASAGERFDADAPVKRMIVKDDDEDWRSKSGHRRACLTADPGQAQYTHRWCQQGQTWTRVLPEDSSVIETNSLPDDPRLLPEVGNGHVATVIGSDTIYMNGLYNGANIASHRARIPSVAAVFINITTPQTGWTRKYRMDFATGVFSEIITADDFTVQVNRYAHRELTSLLVTEVIVNRTDTARRVVLTFTVNHGDASQDIDFQQQGQGMMSGRTKVAEYADVAGTTPVTVVYSTVLPNQTFDSITQAYMPFFTSISTHPAEAADGFNEGMDRMVKGTLFSSHVHAWAEVWRQGRIDLEGNATMATITNAALYYLLSSVPDKGDDKWPFVGMAPGGLAHGSADKDYHGRIFWDQDTWMFPPLALLHVDIGRIILGSRLRTHKAALQYANMTGFKGARYPWESAFTGLNVNPANWTTEYEIHVTGDVSWMMRQYLRLTNDTHFLLQGGYQALADMADYFVDRFTKLHSTSQYGILDAMGPDEWNYPVNNSAYVNTVAAWTLYNAQYAAYLANKTAHPEWLLVATNVYMPFDKDKMFHPEYDGYQLGTVVKQADTILLGFPLDWPLTDDVRNNDLSYYATVPTPFSWDGYPCQPYHLWWVETLNPRCYYLQVTDPKGPAMTWGMFCVNWLRVGNITTANQDFFRGTWNVQDPFKVWSENADGSGAYNFHTGMGGYLQSLLFGYAGFDLDDHYLALHPRLPPTLTSVTITGVDYGGNSFDVAYDDDVMNVTVTRGDDSLVIVLEEEGRWERLPVGVTVTAKCQPGRVLRPISIAL